MVVMKTCPACGAAFAWPLDRQETPCPSCRKTIRIEGYKPYSSSGAQKVMLVGIAILALGFVVAVLSAL